MKLLSVSSIALPSLLLLPIIIQLFRTPTTILAQDFTTIDLSSCNTITNYTSGSWFEYNLKNLLFPTLISNGSVHGFFNTSSGRDSDTVYGLVQCRFDVLGDQCLSCLTIASKSILKNCPNKMDAIIYSEGCLLRYSNVRFFSQLKNLDAVDYIPWTWNNDKNISDQPAFNKQLKVLFNNLTSLASSKPSKYGTAFFNYNDLGTIYGLADCTQDLSSTDCMSCLRYVVSAIPGCCSGYKGARVISWSCQIWYRDYEFFTLPSASPDSPSPDKVSDTNEFLKPGTKIKTEKENNNARIYMVVIPVVAAVLLFAFAFSICLLQRKATREKAYRGTVQTSTVHLEGAERNEVDVPFVDFDIILAATDNFSLSNKLGQGGFGPVYKGSSLYGNWYSHQFCWKTGTFRGGQKMAVKRLSRSSGQGLEEFRNEVLLIAKLQHRNLVKLLGYCIKDDEKVLLYEYMPNKSLDFFIFDRTLCLIINWEKRLDIILGIARGILYLHQDSRLRIIHRDLKTSNILLDEEMNPKISDFGLARICGETQTAGSTNRVVGTYGYMAPEYALDGLFSAKSDVYSFGVVLLEIISGKKNSGFHVSEDSLSLISYAWRLWNENKVLDFIDHSLCEACNAGEVLKCIQVGLLCVQEDANDRPTISSVILMLGSKATNLPTPKQPAFVLRRYQSSTTTSSSGPESCSKNEITISVEEGR